MRASSWIPFEVAVQQVGEGPARLLGHIVNRHMLTITPTDPNPDRYRDLDAVNAQGPTPNALLIHIDDLVAYIILREYDRAEAAGKTEMQADKISDQSGVAFARSCLAAAEHARNPNPNPNPGPLATESVPATTDSPSPVVGRGGRGVRAASAPVQRPESGGDVPTVPVVPCVPARGVDSLSNAQRPRPRSVSCPDAARNLCLSLSRIHGLIGEGKLTYEVVSGRKMIYIEDVESYGRLREKWRQLGGRWTPYGRLPKRRNPDRFHACGPRRPNTESDFADFAPADSEPRLISDRWIRAEEAAAILSLSIIRVGVLGRQGKMVRHIGHTPPDGQTHAELAQRGAPAPAWYLLSSVLALAAERDHAASARGFSPKEWAERTGPKPFIRCKIEPPPGDRLIRRDEAAAILGIAGPRVSMLVAQGRLFGWQTHPGKPGCPLYLSERQVLRYRDDPDRLRRRSAAFGESALHPSSFIPHPSAAGWTNSEIWRRDNNLEDSGGHERDHGEYFSARQAARILGTSIGAVLTLRKRRRLQGYRVKTSRGPSDRQWWFFRKDDVYNLLADPEYVRRRDRAHRAPGMVLPDAAYDPP